MVVKIIDSIKLIETQITNLQSNCNEITSSLNNFITKSQIKQISNISDSTTVTNLTLISSMNEIINSINSINFSYSHDWTFVLKIQQSDLQSLEVGWDYNSYNFIQNNYCTNGYLNGGAPRYYQIFSLANRPLNGQGVNTFNTNIFNISAIQTAQINGYYLEISYSNTTKTIGLIMKDLLFNIIISANSSYTYQYNIQPFYIYSNSTYINFYNYILYYLSSTAPASYSFPII